MPAGVSVDDHGKEIEVATTGGAAALQWAVDCVCDEEVTGEDPDADCQGRVRLEDGVHDFGADGSVELRRSVSLRGRGQAVISGGWTPLCINAPGEDVVIRELALEGATLAGVMGLRAGSARVADLLVTDVHGAVVTNRAGGPNTIAVGILFSEDTFRLPNEPPEEEATPHYERSIQIVSNRVELTEDPDFFVAGVNLVDFDKSAIEIVAEDNEILLSDSAGGGFVSVGFDLAGVNAAHTTLRDNVVCMPVDPQTGEFYGVAARPHFYSTTGVEVVDSALYGGLGGLLVWARDYAPVGIFSDLRIEGAQIGIGLWGWLSGNQFEHIRLGGVDIPVDAPWGDQVDNTFEHFSTNKNAKPCPLLE